MRFRLTLKQALVSAALAVLSASCSSLPPQRSAAAVADNSAARISKGMQRLGATPARGDCYASRVVKSLDEDDRIAAAGIIEASKSKEEMRSGVLDADERIRQAFIRAHFGCSLYG